MIFPLFWKGFLSVTLLAVSSKMADDPTLPADGSFHLAELGPWQMWYHGCPNPMLGGRATAQAVSRWLPTAAARVRARAWSCEI
jgi:hypothetical protein